MLADGLDELAAQLADYVNDAPEHGRQVQNWVNWLQESSLGAVESGRARGDGGTAVSVAGGQQAAPTARAAGRSARLPAS
jgi:hypothetical protein